MKNVSITRKLTLVLAASGVITLGASLGLSYLLRVSSADSSGLAATARAQSQASFEMLDLLVKVQGVTQRMVQESDPDAIETLMHKNESMVTQARAKIREVAQDDASISTSFEQLLHANEEVTDLLLHAHNAESHQAIIEKSSPAFERLLGANSKYQDKMRQNLDRRAEAAAAHTRHLEIVVYLLVGLSTLLLCLFGLALVRAVSTSLQRLINMVREIAEGDGDLTKRLVVASGDELGELASWFNNFLNKLQQVVSEVAQHAEQVAVASEQLSASTASQAQTNESQTEQAAHIATSVQQMSRTAVQVSENCNRAAEASGRAAATARGGGAIVEQTLTKMRAIVEAVNGTETKMRELAKSSNQIANVARVISDIADQTNLLALNAAIEAARAGEHGRGFAVVADEVRKLAQNTTVATKEIAQMIEAIQNETRTVVQGMNIGSQQVEEGVTTTARAGDSLRQIIQMSEEVGEMITQIATSGREQSSATQDVNRNMDQIAKLVKESAGGAQQSAKACQDLSKLALDLQRLVRQFNIDSTPLRAGMPEPTTLRHRAACAGR